MGNRFSHSYFQNARDCTINGGEFISIAHANVINASDNDAVSTILRQYVATGAIFDSFERCPPAKCHPGTRERVIRKIVHWIEKPSLKQRILWLYGPAGAGKSALAHTICERHTGRCASFFFARGPTDRGKSFKLFPTLSYQLALQFPAFREALNEALYHDPSLPTKSMEAQLSSLIIQPFMQCKPSRKHSPILIIDGLDECAEDQGMDTQCDIIAVICQSIIKHKIPLRFLIASRPESWIRDKFESSPLPSITLSLSLRDDIDADKDIKTYLTDGFEKIRLENKRIMGSVTPPWPPTNIVNRFVYEASGQYIYASTVLRFVGKSSRFNDPQEQLRILTSPGPHRALAFSELDRLCETIISAYPRWETMKLVLGGILACANLTVIEKALRVGSTELSLVLDALSPLIDVEIPGPLSEHEQSLEEVYGSLTAGRDKLRLYHLSFREFLEDKKRSAVFHIDVCDVATDIARAFFRTIHANIDQNYATEPHISFNISPAVYCEMMSVMAGECIRNSDIDILCQLITTTTHRLLHLEPSPEMEYFGCCIADMDWLLTIAASLHHRCLSQEKADNLKHSIAELQDAARHVRTRCIHLLSLCRGSIFLAIPFSKRGYRFHSVAS